MAVNYRITADVACRWLHDFQDLESQMQQDNESMKEQMRLLEDQMEMEKRRREDAENESNKQKQVGF